MRLRERVERWFMNDFQRALRDPAQYEAQVDAAAILDDLRSGRAGVRDPESRQYMTAAIEDEFRAHGKLTIAGLVDQYGTLDQAMKGPYDRSLYEPLLTGRLGAHLAADYLIRRANAIADGVKPGAAELLAQAFDVRA